MELWGHVSIEKYENLLEKQAMFAKFKSPSHLEKKHSTDLLYTFASFTSASKQTPKSLTHP